MSVLVCNWSLNIIVLLFTGKINIFFFSFLRKENCHHNHIPLNLKWNASFLSVTHLSSPAFNQRNNLIVLMLQVASFRQTDPNLVKMSNYSDFPRNKVLYEIWESLRVTLKYSGLSKCRSNFMHLFIICLFIYLCNFFAFKGESKCMKLSVVRLSRRHANSNLATMSNMCAFIKNN